MKRQKIMGKRIREKRKGEKGKSGNGGKSRLLFPLIFLSFFVSYPWWISRMFVGVEMILGGELRCL